MENSLILMFSWFTIAAEIVLPLLFMFPRLKNWSLFGLFVFQALIAYFSGEIDFAFTAFAILFLFIPKASPWSYYGLAILLFVVQPWV
jgi:hypothetical protein